MRTYHVAGGTWRTCSMKRMRLRWTTNRQGVPSHQERIAGWTPQLRDRKIDQLASVIAAMNTGQGPDLLGVCEVENRFVVDRLVERVKQRCRRLGAMHVVHADTGDARGIDIAFIYDDTLFQVPLPLEESVFFHVVMRRHATREIVQVNFKTTTAAARTWAVFGNHWPSRSGGQFESEGYRAIAGETLSYFHHGSSRCTDRRHPCSRWGTSTTNRSILPLFGMHSAPGSEPR